MGLVEAAESGLDLRRLLLAGLGARVGRGAGRSGRALPVLTAHRIMQGSVYLAVKSKALWFKVGLKISYLH